MIYAHNYPKLPILVGALWVPLPFCVIFWKSKRGCPSKKKGTHCFCLLDVDKAYHQLIQVPGHDLGPDISLKYDKGDLQVISCHPQVTSSDLYM